MRQPHKIEQDFVVISPDKKASIEHADAELYERIDGHYNSFIGHELISCYEFEPDWSSWEVHPHGDEIVLLISGDVAFLLQTESGEDSDAALGARMLAYIFDSYVSVPVQQIVG